MYRDNFIATGIAAALLCQPAQQLKKMKKTRRFIFNVQYLLTLSFLLYFYCFLPVAAHIQRPGDAAAAADSNEIFITRD